jgi:hypothetical protein
MDILIPKEKKKLSVKLSVILGRTLLAIKQYLFLLIKAISGINKIWLKIMY